MLVCDQDACQRTAPFSSHLDLYELCLVAYASWKMKWEEEGSEVHAECDSCIAELSNTLLAF